MLSDLERKQKAQEAKEALKQDVRLWRKRMLKQVRELPEGADRGRLARQVYEIDQMSMHSGQVAMRWTEIEHYLVPLTEAEEKEKRDRLVKPRPAKSRKQYKDYQLPTLEDYGKLYGPPGKREAAEKPPRFKGPVGRVMSRDELFKETYPELFGEDGEMVPFDKWEFVETDQKLPKFLSYSERKAKGQ